VSEEENQELEAENMQRREEMEVFKAELEGMQVKSVNLARENADSESEFSGSRARKRGVGGGTG
jgi:hypothetical protein